MIKNIIQHTTQTDLWAHSTRLVCNSGLCMGNLLLAGYETALLKLGIQLIHSKTITCFCSIFTIYPNEKDLLNFSHTCTLWFLNAAFWHTIICRVSFKGRLYFFIFDLKMVYCTPLGKDFFKHFPVWDPSSLSLVSSPMWHSISWLFRQFLSVASFSCLLSLGPSWVLDQQQHTL